MNTFGNIFRVTTFGESHGPAMGGIIDGVPPGAVISLSAVADELARRAPGKSSLTSTRREPDNVEFLSGLMAIDASTGDRIPLSRGSDSVVSLGTPIGFIVRNNDARSGDYDRLRHVYRPSHADYAWEKRYGLRDWRGGGRSSGRETVSRVVAGAVARQLLATDGVAVSAHIISVGNVDCPTADDIAREINRARAEGDSIGGMISCTVTGLPAGVGEPVFGKLDQMIGGAMLSIGAVKGVEFGMGFGGCRNRGSEVSDAFALDAGGKVVCPENFSGGVQGGISNGMPVVFDVCVKPTPTISRPLAGLDDSGKPVTFTPAGRHDPSVLMRVLPVVEAMTAITVLDAMMMRRAIPPALS